MDTDYRYRAYQGPNGWYVAAEDGDGYHRQPDDGGDMSRASAVRSAAARNRRIAAGDYDDYDRDDYDDDDYDDYDDDDWGDQ